MVEVIYNVNHCPLLFGQLPLRWVGVLGCLQVYDAAVEDGMYKRVELSKLLSLEMEVRMVAMGPELYQSCPEADIST